MTNLNPQPNTKPTLILILTLNYNLKLPSPLVGP